VSGDDDGHRPAIVLQANDPLHATGQLTGEGGSAISPTWADASQSRPPPEVYDRFAIVES